MEEVRGYIERLTYQNDENGFTVAQLQMAGKNHLVCIVGTLPALQPGETIQAKGFWKVNPQYGQQFEIKKYHTTAPSDLIGIKKYLQSGLIHGIGPAYAERIVKKFGINTLDIIDKAPERLGEVDGIGKKRLEQIINCWQAQRAIRDIMIFLQTHGVTPSYAQKIFKAYGAESIEKVKENPYNLCKNIFGIGFKTADKIAQSMGITNISSQRIDSGVEYVLSELSNDGHVCHPVTEFLEIAAAMLEVESSLVEERLKALHEEERIVLTDLLHEGEKLPFIWLKPIYLCEVGIAREVQRLRLAKSELREIDSEKAIAWVEQELDISLAPLQKRAVAHALADKLQIITGGPGTGKSTITNAILTISQHLTKNILLAAPTGRAAKRMAEITGREAKTIHSLLKFDFKKRGFKHNRENPLTCDLMIIDEASMIDNYLMYCLLKAIPNHTRLIFVGDTNQLPSVGAGNVLRDMIQSTRLPVTELTEIFRQAAGSAIITSAHLINNGRFPDIRNKYDGDFFFIPAEEKEDVLDNLVNLVSSRLPKKYGLDPFDEIQLLSPMKKGVIGTENLNKVLQGVLNNKQEELYRKGYSYRVGDKVMQIRNNYNKEVFNGDVGRIVYMDQEEQILRVDIDSRIVEYAFHELDELVLAYAVSVHKYQGSECPCIVMPVHTSHYKLLHRNLLYTGVTRGKKLVVIVGTKKAVAIAVRNNEVRNRYTGLRQALLDIKNDEKRVI